MELMSLLGQSDTIAKGGAVIVAFLLLDWITRKLPNELIYEQVKKVGVILTPFEKITGLAISTFLMKWLPRKIADRAEEGLLSSLLVAVSAALSRVADFPKNVVKYMTEDNQRSVRKKKAKE